MTSECTNNKVFDLVDVAELPVEEAWDELVKSAKEAVESRDLDDFRNVRVSTLPQFLRGYLEDRHRSLFPSMHQHR